MADNDEELEEEKPEEELPESENDELGPNDDLGPNSDESNNEEKEAEAPKGIKNLLQNKLVTFLLANPFIIIVAGFMLLIIIVLAIVIISFGRGGSSGKGYGGMSYIPPAHGCEDISVFVYLGERSDKVTEVIDTVSINDYLIGVLYAEVASIPNDEVLKAMAVAARSFYMMRLSADCSIEGSDYAQAYTPVDSISDSQKERMQNAIDATEGRVLLDASGSLMTAEYDSFRIIPELSTGSYYTLEQRSDEHLEVPKSWVESRSYFACDLNNKPNGCGHGRGMSQNGAWYLADEFDYDYIDILNWFYSTDKVGGGISFGTTIPDYGGWDDLDFNLTAEINRILELPKTTNIQNKYGSIQMYLAINHLTKDVFDQRIMGYINENGGPHSRGAVVASAVALIGGLADYGVRIPYWYGHTEPYSGINPDWGINKASASPNYNYYGLDCASFVAWAVFNGGYNHSFAFNWSGLIRREQYVDANYNGLIARQIDSNSAMARPGDILVFSQYWATPELSDGHIALVVGIDEANKQYIVAESHGEGGISGSGGVEIRKWSFGRRIGGYLYYYVDMSEYYSNSANYRTPSYYPES